MSKIISSFADVENLTNCLVCNKLIKDTDRGLPQFYHCGGHLTVRCISKELYADLPNIGIAVYFNQNKMNIYDLYQKYTQETFYTPPFL